MDKIKNDWVVAGMLIMSFLGGMAGQWVLRPPAVYAQSDPLSTDRLYFTDADGKVVGQVYSSPGSGAIISLDAHDGSQRLQLGTYSGSGEQGLPLVGLSDNGSELRMLMRLAGPNESPVMIFKDKGGRDRIVLGLGLQDAAQEPFLAVFDEHGAKKMIFGAY